MENKKWTKKYLVIIWLITLIVVIAAICGHFFKLASFWGFGFENYDVDVNTYDFSKETVSEIVIDMNAADINIEYGNEFSVDASFPDKYAPTVDMNNGKLEIKQRQNIKNWSGSNDFLLNITVPNNTTLDTLKIDVSAGDVDIKDIKANKLIIDANAGDIDVNDITSEKITIDANAGDINVMGSTAKNIEVNVNAGDVDITGTYDKIDCDCDLGDIDISAPDTDIDDIDVDCALGSVNVNGTSKK